MKQAIDNIHEAIMRHKKTMLNLQSMGPQLLQKNDATHKTPLQERLHKLQTETQRLQQQLHELYEKASAQNKVSEKAMVDAIVYAQWPLEALAVRKGVRLIANSGEEKKAEDSTTEMKVRDALNQSLATIDRVDRMPSNYYWEMLHTLEHQAQQLLQQVSAVQQQIQQSRALATTHPQNQNAAIADIIETQHIAVTRLEQQLRYQSQQQMELVRYRYSQYERGENVLERAAMQERERQRLLQEQIQMQCLQAGEAAPASSAPAPFGAPAPSTTSSSGGGLFGTAAPAPTSGIFGSTPAPAPLFGGSSTTTPPATAPAPFSFGGGGGGSTPAAAAPLFGGATPAPNAFAGLPAATTTTPSTKKKSGSKSSGRLKR